MKLEAIIHIFLYDLIFKKRSQPMTNSTSTGSHAAFYVPSRARPSCEDSSRSPEHVRQPDLCVQATNAIRSSAIGTPSSPQRQMVTMTIFAHCLRG